MTQKMETACSNNFLWPPIHDALDTYLRRRVNGADPYERAWRLIHVWEACEITLAIAVLSQVRVTPALQPTFLRMREAFHGMAWDEMKRSFRTVLGAKDGSIDQWINILDVSSRADTGPPTTFLAAVRSFLLSPGIDIGPLIDGWARACDAPRDPKVSDSKVIEAMRHVNTFRNRFAHVPFPHDPLAEIADSLEALTERLFSIQPEPLSHEKGGESSALTGALRVGRRFLRGGQQDVISSERGTELEFVFPCKKNGDVESWAASAFVYCDGMSRVHVVTRLKGFDVCEYTRFRAEANAVFVREDTGLGRVCPSPDVKEYETEPEVDLDEPVLAPSTESEFEPTRPPHESTLAEAIEAIRLDQFDRAVEILEAITAARPNYHVAWLRLGHARREAAVRQVDRFGAIEADKVEAIGSLYRAVVDLGRAAQHIEERYRALALYERSKTHYQLFRTTRDSAEWALANEDATKARTKSTEPKYQSWSEYLESRKPHEALPEKEAEQSPLVSETVE
jgi:hypothetical protein